MKKEFLFLFILFFSLCLVSSSTYTVGIGKDYQSIQNAIDNSNNGDLILVDSGCFNESLVINKEISLRGNSYLLKKNGYSVPEDYNWDNETVLQSNSDSNIVTISSSNVVFEGFIVQALNRSSSGDRNLIHIDVPLTENLSNLTLKNNVIGPNTNILSQDGNKGRMNLYIDLNPRNSTGLIDSFISNNKIFASEGNGDNIFIWGSYHSYDAPGLSTMKNTIIYENEIYNSHRTGIEIAGGVSDLKIENNNIYNNSGFFFDDPDKLKYGHGILIIRGSSDKLSDSSAAYSCENLVIINNTIFNNEKSGIYFGPVNKNYNISYNNISYNGWDGIMLDMDGQFWNPTFEGNVSPNGKYSSYNSSSNIFAHYNVFSNNNYYSIRVVGNSTNDFIFNATYNYWGVPILTTNYFYGDINYLPYYKNIKMKKFINKIRKPLDSKMDFDSDVEVVVGKDNCCSEINISGDCNVTLNLSEILNCSYGKKNAKLKGGFLIKKNEAKKINLEIPNNVTIIGNINWTGELFLPKIKESSKKNFDKNFELEGIVEIGSSDFDLNLTRGVRLFFEGQAGKNIGYVDSNKDFFEIERICGFDSQEFADNLSNGSDCKINIGDDLVVWTRHFTEFVYYKERNSDFNVGSGVGGTCIYDLNFDWGCSDWSECLNGIQTRVCKKYNNCGSKYGKPIEVRNCSLFNENIYFSFDIEKCKLNLDEDLRIKLNFISDFNVKKKIKLNYKIFDKDSNEIYFEEESFFIKEEISIIKSFESLDLNVGDYKIVVGFFYDEKKDEIENEFQFIKKKNKVGITGNLISDNIESKVSLLAVIISVLLILLVLFFVKKKK